MTYEYPPVGGGGGQTALKLSEEFARDGHNVHVLTSHCRGLSHEKTIGRLRVTRMWCMRKKLDRCSIFEMIVYIVVAIFRGQQLIKYQWPDVVLSVFAIPSGVAGFFLATSKSAPHVISLQGGDVPGFLANEIGIYHTICMPLTRYLWRRAASVVANSNGLAQLSCKSVKDVTVKVIPMGVDAVKFRPNDDIENCKNPNDAVECIFVGRLVAQKDPLSLIKCFSLAVKEIGTSIRLNIYGDGILEKKLRQFVVEEGLQRQVIFHGWIDYKRMPEAFRSSDIYLQTSHFEGMSGALMQAMASGLPVILFSCQGQEMIENGVSGIIIESRNIIEYAEKIVLLHSNPQLRSNMGMAARATALTQSWDVIAKRYLDLFYEAHRQ
ncbi:glycosyltransferase family 4 protein [Candidatus Magnetominusculus dajiuhuensis]|uniref:glycosyltransferase family 4 protein n=1 Tax=Candidatus Magnetominusculus dajiuhuensis TaxID=3137712 RepID=UPI003B43873E